MCQGAVTTAACTEGTHAIGTAVWVADDKRAWVKGIVRHVQGQTVVVVTDDGQERTCSSSACLLQNTDQSSVDDMTKLAFLHEPGVLWNLAQRYGTSDIYTRTGNILIAINPFAQLPHLYGDSIMVSYRAALDLMEEAPHVYAIAAQAYRQMMAEQRGQAILVTGESGAGKTETSKLIMRYLAYLGGHEAARRQAHAQQNGHSHAQQHNGLQNGHSHNGELLNGVQQNGQLGASVEQKVLQSNPLLEAFGNAKTVRNDNSSRFGKYVEINFNSVGAISGAAIRTYLLERSRVVHLSPSERSYHAFYQLCYGASAEERQRWRLPGGASGSGAEAAAGFRYLAQSGCYELPRVDNAEEYRVTREAMAAVGMGPDAQDAVFQVVAALLHLGNVEFVTDPSDHEACLVAPGAPEQHLEAAATLLGVEAPGLLRALTTRTRMTPDGSITSPLGVKASAANRDALAKVLYARLFDWLVCRINESIGEDPNATASVGLLDIYGFESFASNDLEQLCINLANEKLQQHFNQYVFKWEQADYEKEGIDWSYIDFVDNQDVLDLIEGKLGLLDLLDEQCRWPNATAADLAAKLHGASACANCPRFGRPKKGGAAGFSLSHYAGPVTYACDNFLDKNRDYVVEEHRLLLGASSCSLVAELFPAPAEVASDNTRSGGSRNAFKFVSVASQFKKQLGELMAQLHTMEPHYIRCIKPNPASEPQVLDAPYVLNQLKCGGVMEAVRISCAGYPYRRTYPEFIDAFWQLRPASRHEPDAAASTSALVADAGLQPGADYQLGHTKVFLRSTKAAHLSKLRTLAQASAATTVQKCWRGRQARLDYQALRAASLLLQAWVRGTLARQEAWRIRRWNAALQMQSLWRGVVARRRFRQECAARVVQKNWRMVRAQRAFKRQRAALVVQKGWRMCQARGVYQQQRAAATALAAAWRARGARVQAQLLRQERAAVALQAAWRGAAARAAVAVRLQELRLARAALLLQSAWRAVCVRRAFSVQLAALREARAATVYQAAWRGLLARRTAANLRQRHEAASRIQAGWRGYRVRAAVPKYGPQQEAAAVKLQAAWRHYAAHGAHVRRFRAVVVEYMAVARAAGVLQRSWRVRQACKALKRAENERRRQQFKEQMRKFEALAEQALGGPAPMPPPKRPVSQNGYAPRQPSYGVQYMGAQQTPGAPPGRQPSVSARALSPVAVPDVDVVRAEDSGQLSPDSRLKARLGALGGSGKVKGLLSMWKSKLAG